MKKQDKMLIKVSDAIAHFGTATALTKALGVTPQAVTSWGYYMPKLRAYELKANYPRDFKAILKRGEK